MIYHSMTLNVLRILLIWMIMSSIKKIQFEMKVDKILNGIIDDNSSVISEVMSKYWFKLPKVELKKFNRKVKEWLGSWGQLKKNHIDNDIVLEDKFIYLSQTTNEGSHKNLMNLSPSLLKIINRLSNV